MAATKSTLSRQESRRLEDYLLAEWPKIKESDHTMQTLADQINAQKVIGLPPRMTKHNIEGALEVLDLLFEMPRARGPRPLHNGEAHEHDAAIEAMQELCGSLEARLAALEAGHGTTVRNVQAANTTIAQHDHRIQQMHGLTEGERANIETRLRSLENIAARFQRIEDLLKDNKSKLGRLATRSW